MWLIGFVFVLIGLAGIIAALRIKPQLGSWSIIADVVGVCGFGNILSVLQHLW